MNIELDDIPLLVFSLVAASMAAYAIYHLIRWGFNGKDGYK